MDFRLSHSLKALLPMDTTPSGRRTLVSAVQLRKAFHSIVFRNVGSVISLSAVQSLKAFPPIVSMAEGSTIDVKLEQF